MEYDGYNPQSSGVAIDSVGNLYGTTYFGGHYDFGIVFRLAQNGDGRWKETILHSFKDHPGALPVSGVIFDGNGTLYGSTSGDGNVTFGSVFQIVP